MQRYQVDISRNEMESVKVIKALRIIGGMSLKKATEVFAYISMHKTATVAAGLSKPVAERIVEQLVAQRITAQIGASSVSSPMLLETRVEKLFEWTRMKSLRVIEL